MELSIKTDQDVAVAMARKFLTVDDARTTVDRNWWSRLRDCYVCWQRRDYNRQQLGMLSEHSARDIGLSHYDRMREVARPFWRQ